MGEDIVVDGIYVSIEDRCRDRIAQYEYAWDRCEEGGVRRLGVSRYILWL